MKINTVSFGGLAINDGTVFASKIIGVPPYSESEEIKNSRTQYPPEWGGRVLRGGEFETQVDMKGTASAQIETLARYFDTELQDLQSFVIEDTNASKQWQINAACTDIKKWEGNAITYKMYAPDPVWKSVTQYSGTISIAGTTSASGTITVGGNKETYPTIEITPVSYPTGGYGYRQYIQFYNRSTKALNNYPVNLGGTANYIDTATLVGAGKLQADCDDLRVMVNGQEVDRWINGANSATTSVWININALPAITMLTGAAISSSGTPTYITVKNTPADIVAIKKVPSKGIVLIDSEEFSYNGVDVVNRRLTVTGRAIRNTTAAVHALGATARFIEFDIVLLYGNPSVDAPDIDSTYEPIINLANSTNIQHDYLLFRDENAKRSGIWSGNKIAPPRDTSYVYTGNQGTVDEYPAISMGVYGAPYYFGVTLKPETVTANWTLYTPCQGTAITTSGYKYLNTLSSTYPVITLQRSTDGITYTNEATYAKPSTANTWQAWTTTNEALAAASYYIRFLVNGALSAISGNYGAFQVDSATVYFNSAITPYVNRRAEEQNYWFDVTITNDTTGEGLIIKYPIEINQTLYIDTDARTVTYRGISALASTERDGNRAEWLRLLSGDNAISYSTDSGGTVALVFNWYDRQNM